MTSTNRNTTTYYQVKKSPKRIVVNQGGTSSGKTGGILRVLIEWCFLNKYSNYIISIVRKTTPALRKSVYRDFLQILIAEEIYDPKCHNKTNMEYNLFGNTIEFFGLDDSQKARGGRRDILFLNEANELSLDNWIQLSSRTRKKIILDYNPSMVYHWIYDSVLTLPENAVDFFKTTYLDNPFIEEPITRTYESIKEQDPNYYRWFILGERAISQHAIYTNSELADVAPGKIIETVYGLDFGYTVPTALIRCDIGDGWVFCTELLYESHLTNSQLIGKLRTLITDKRQTIYADAAEPDRIQEIYTAGFNVKKAFKDIQDGIDSTKRVKLLNNKESTNMIREEANYQYRTDKDGKILEPSEPVKANDHLMDARRYAIASYFRKPKFEVWR